MSIWTPSSRGRTSYQALVGGVGEHLGKPRGDPGFTHTTDGSPVELSVAA